MFVFFFFPVSFSGLLIIYYCSFESTSSQSISLAHLICRFVCSLKEEAKKGKEAVCVCVQ